MGTPKKKQKWLNDVKHREEVWKDARQDDIVVLIVGQTGVGKSTFVNYLAKGAGIGLTAKVGDDLESCTATVQPIPIPAHNIPKNVTIGGPRLVVVDTPGFDDTYADESEIRRHIEAWLASYSKDMKPDGIIYLHDITQSNMPNNAVKTFKGICREYGAVPMILGTTKWAEVSLAVAEKHERQMWGKYWVDEMKQGTRTARFEGTSESAWDIVNQILSKERPKRGTAQDLKGRADDIVVLVMGPTGAGKSTFVKHLIRGAGIHQTVKIGEDLTSCTIKLQAIPIPASEAPISLRGRGSRVIIVDTPSFDNTYEEDTAILRHIATWLASSYSNDMKLGGVIYLHDISSSNPHPKDFEVFRALCGDSAAMFTILGTTKSASVSKKVTARHEKELRENLWATTIRRGAKMKPFENTSESAWKMVEALLPSVDRVARTLRIQEELVELEKIIPATDAGKKLAQMKINQRKVPLFQRFKNLFS